MAESRSRRWLRMGLKLGGGLAFGGAVLALVGAVAVAWLYREHVIHEPGAHLERRHIRSIIAQESPVYYRDGSTRVGVFFESEHRQYVPWETLPLAWVMGITAAEDASFFQHFGVDPKGIARAMRDNLTAGTLVAGGSTLTQQTAKNLYYRPDRSLRSKGVELLNALRLEAHYDKTEILTFYANQFHVSGNGRGLGIGARHFFDKDVEELSVAEAAFLAGLVKAPSRYDPFLGDVARRDRAEAAAHDRTRYVLRRIVEVDAVDLVGPVPARDDADGQRAWGKRLQDGRAVQAEAQRLLDEGFTLEFRRGVFRYDASAVLDEVARRLGEAPFDTLLADVGIDDPATAGLQVITTLDAPVQEAATYGLWHHLTEVGLELEQRTAKDLIVGGRGPRFDPDNPPTVRSFRLATVAGEREVAGKRTLDLDLGGHGCHVDRAGLVRIAAAAAKGASGNRGTKAQTADVDAVVDTLVPGSVVHASVRSLDGDTAVCDLELTPEVQGAAMVLEGGRIRAMVGGNDNRNFNRATALRQMGSTWKPLVYHAALQLGWSPDDLLDNRRGVFPFSTTFYYPRPDHEPAPVVSMSWAGVNSENLASVWLLYHLMDKLDGEQVRTLAETLELARGEDEDEKAYRTRIQKAGVLPTRGRVVEALFLQARHEMLAGMDTERHPEDALALQSLLFGWGHGNESQTVQREGPRTRVWKQRALDNNWRHLSSMRATCRAQHDALERALRQDRAPRPDLVEDLSVLIDGERVRVACGAIPEGYTAPDEEFFATLDGRRPSEDDDEVDGEPEAAEDAPDTEDAPEPETRNPVSWFDRIMRRARRPQLEEAADLLIDDRLHLSTLDALSDALDRRELAMSLRDEAPDLYDPSLLYWHSDFRVLLAIRYVASLAEDYGVQTEIPPVLSMPLGATEITLEEATSVYGGLVNGVAWSFPGEAMGREVGAPPTPALLIAEIRDVDGNVLYRANPEQTPVAEPGTAHLTAHILRNVVRHGTGRRATAITADGRQIPVGGKTGTTNEFRNAAFLGYAPVWSAGSYRVDGGYAVGVYVGYDDNRPLVNQGIRLAGSSGALPAWIGTIEGLRDSGLLGVPEVAAAGAGQDSAEWPLGWAPGLELVPVDGSTGRSLEEPGVEVLEDADAPRVLVRKQEAAPKVDYHPFRRPPRIFPRTEDFEPERAPAGRNPGRP